MFLVEDGTGIAGANAYTTVAFMRSYWTDRGVTFAQADSVLQVALIGATDYVESRYAGRFKGSQVFPGVQTLSFPRQCIYDLNGNLLAAGVPTGIQSAIAEYAKRALVAPLLPDPTIARNIQSLSETVGPIVEATTFFGAPPIFTPYPAADLLLRTFLRAAGGTYR